MQSRIMALVVGVVVCATAGTARAATEPHPIRWVQPEDGRSLSVVQPTPRGFGSVQPNPRLWSVIAPNPRMFARDEPSPRTWGKVQPKPRLYSTLRSRLASTSTAGGSAESDAIGRWGAVGRWGRVVPNPRQWGFAQPNPPRSSR